MDIRFLHMLGTMYLWCVAASSSSPWNIPTPVDQFLDGCIVQMQCIVRAAVATGQHPGKKSGHMLHLVCHQKLLGTICLQQDSGVMNKSTGEWNGSLLSSVMRVGSVCMQVMDMHVYSTDLVSISFQSVFAHNT